MKDHMPAVVVGIWSFVRFDGPPSIVVGLMAYTAHLLVYAAALSLEVFQSWPERVPKASQHFNCPLADVS